jgi:hypothetical protein
LVALALLLHTTKAKTQTSIKTTEQPMPAAIPTAFVFFPATAAYTEVPDVKCKLVVTL